LTLGEEEIISLLNQAKYLFLRHITEPEDNALRLVVEEAIADRTESIPTPVPGSQFAELRKGASPIKSVEGCGAFELQWSRYVAYLVTDEGVGSGGSDEDEDYTGKLFRVYTKSHFLDHLGGWLTLRATRRFWVPQPFAPSPAKGAVRSLDSLTATDRFVSALSHPSHRMTSCSTANPWGEPRASGLADSGACNRVSLFAYPGSRR